MEHVSGKEIRSTVYKYNVHERSIAQVPATLIARVDEAGAQVPTTSSEWGHLVDPHQSCITNPISLLFSSVPCCV